jgi:hypothetical protein
MSAFASIYVIQSCNRLFPKAVMRQLSWAWLDPALLIWVTDAEWRPLDR